MISYACTTVCTSIYVLIVLYSVHCIVYICMYEYIL